MHFNECALPHKAAPKAVDGRLIDYPEMGQAIDNQPDIDGIVVAAANEFLGSVERINEEEGVAVRGDAAFGNFLLGDHRHAGRGGGERRQDDRLGGAVADRDGTEIALGLDLVAGRDQLQYLRSGRPRGDDTLLKQCGVVGDQRGAIRMPPSSRMLSALR